MAQQCRMLEPHALLALLAGCNALAFGLFGLDKALSKMARSRVPEKWLLAAAAVLASPGALLGMVIFNHKTSKPSFRYGVPTLIAAHAALAYWLSGYA